MAHGKGRIAGRDAGSEVGFRFQNKDVHHAPGPGFQALQRVFARNVNTHSGMRAGQDGNFDDLAVLFSLIIKLRKTWQVVEKKAILLL